MTGDGIQITRVVDGFSSHTLSRARRGYGVSADTKALRRKLIEAMVEVVSEGGDPRLAQSRAGL